MNQPSAELVAFFEIQVALVAMFWTWTLGRRAGIGIGIFLAGTWLAAYAGWMRFGPIPPPVPALLVPVTIATAVMARRAPVERLGLGWLIGFQSFRILVEIFLWWGHREGVVPVQLTWEGRNFDVLTGLSAPVMGWLAARGSLATMAIKIWNLAGLALLVNVVSVAALSMPTPLQRFEPVNLFVAEAPFVWLPLFLVQSAWFGHVALWRLTGRDQEPPAHGTRAAAG